VSGLLSPARFGLLPPDQTRCCYCFGLFEANACRLADQRWIHKDCLGPLLKALEQPDLELIWPDGTLEKVKGFQPSQPWLR